MTKARATATRCCSPPESSFGHARRLVREPDQLEDLGDLLVDHRRRAADHLEAERDVLEDGLVGQQAEVLEDAADVAPQVGDAPLREVDDVAARLEDAARLGELLSQQEAQERRLARARRADDEDELALVDLEGHVAERDGARPVGLGDVLQLNHEERCSWHVGQGRAVAVQRAYRSSPLDLRHGAARRLRSSASMNASMSPSSTSSTLPVSTSVRRSFTSWYGREHVRADLAPPRVVRPLARQQVELGLALLARALGELGREDLHRARAVLVLAPLVLAAHDDARRQVRDAHRRVGLVHVLAARRPTSGTCRRAGPSRRSRRRRRPRGTASRRRSRTTSAGGAASRTGSSARGGARRAPRRAVRRRTGPSR